MSGYQLYSARSKPAVTLKRLRSCCSMCMPTHLNLCAFGSFMFCEIKSIYQNMARIL